MMRLGTDTGSLVNHVYSRMTKGAPPAEVGLGATILSWTDRYAGTVKEVRAKPDQSVDVVVVQEDHAERTDGNGMSDMQSYEYSPNPDGRLYYFRPAKRGGWEEVTWNKTTKRWNKTGGYGLVLGYRKKYHDFGF